MIHIKFTKDLCPAQSNYKPFFSLITIGTGLCMGPTIKHYVCRGAMPIVLAHEIGHAVLKHDIGQGKSITEMEVEAWKYAIVRYPGKISTRVVYKCLLSQGVEKKQIALLGLDKAKKPVKLELSQ